MKKRRSSFVATKLLKLLSSLKSLIFPTLSRVRHVNDTRVTSHDTHKHHRNKVVKVEIVKGQQKKRKRERERTKRNNTKKGKMQQSFSSRGQRLFGKGGTPPSLRRRHCNLVSTKQRSKSGIISIIASTNENSKNSSSFSERRKNLNTTNALANDAPTVEDVTSNLNAADLDKEGRTPKKTVSYTHLTLPTILLV